MTAECWAAAAFWVASYVALSLITLAVLFRDVEPNEQWED